jgi:tetratricopeptide (TPR) repeat protein
MNLFLKRFLPWIFVAALLVLGAAVYLPGIDGPWVFDDIVNIVNNQYLRLTTLEPKALWHAAYSLESGPLKRPVSMVSFALNYLAAGPDAGTRPFKLTNIAIHFFNGALVYAFTRLFLTRYRSLRPDTFLARPVYVFAALLAFWWVAHPIAVTSVLYVVQRMASLSASFVLVGVVGYLWLRLRVVPQKPVAGWGLVVIALLLFGGLGILAKESAALLPIFLLVVDFTLFAEERPWTDWYRLPRRSRAVISIIFTFVLIGIVTTLIFYLAPTFASRDFSLLERLLTESRVLWFYLSLIYLPILGRFGLQHDDIALSHSLVSPWTTLPAVLGIVGLVVAGFYLRRRSPLISLGILWFFVAHSIESTILPLELVHEHRNYLASLGALIALLGACDALYRQVTPRSLPIALFALAFSFAAVTIIRSLQWSSPERLYISEAHNHPDSPRALGGYGALLARQGRMWDALTAFRRASALDPDEPGMLINLHIVSAWLGVPVLETEKSRIRELLAHGVLTPLTSITLDYAVGCAANSCRALAPELTIWLDILVNQRKMSTRRKSLYLYMLGRVLDAQGRSDEALRSLRSSHLYDHHYLHPLFEIVNIYLRKGDLERAQKAYQDLQHANKRSLYPRDPEVAALGEILQRRRYGDVAPELAK